ncbi:MAG: hypothetical protein M9953_09605 [Thermomicrobiales bacterium]|nr:hypothetical protein [Thermomicrobiales bacterium]MCO5217757.1 hypothetical protein [Thermomicrobiales bacterium]MCO5225582.1 hypothetical protein [Thermomicrobiales bacterium]MCO5228629.1 hypothetical protein [Thermomicrobiales bacterium]
MEQATRHTKWVFEEDNGGATPQQVVDLMLEYGERLRLLDQSLRITTSRRVFGRWLGRRIPSSYGGAFVHLTHTRTSAILINLERIDHNQPKALEVVVAEELLHMRDWLDGDHRRHAKHGHDRIAYRVADLTGASMDQIRSALVPVKSREFRYVYVCPNCDRRVYRKRSGRWACRPCYERTGRRFVLTVDPTLAPTLAECGNVQ